MYTVVRSTSPIFTLIVAHIRRIEKITPTLSLLILVITSSVALTAVEDLSFDTVGYIYAQSSTIISSLRWVFVQDLLLKSCFPKSYGSIDTSLLTMIWTLPTASLVSLIASLILDGPRSILSSSKLSSWSLALKTFLLFNVESVLGIIILLTELFSLSMISALAFILVGITKEIIVIIAAHFFLNEPLTVIQILGVVISIIGLFTFQYIRTVKKNVDDSG